MWSIESNIQDKRWALKHPIFFLKFNTKKTEKIEGQLETVNDSFKYQNIKPCISK